MQYQKYSSRSSGITVPFQSPDLAKLLSHNRQPQKPCDLFTLNLAPSHHTPSIKQNNVKIKICGKHLLKKKLLPKSYIQYLPYCQEGELVSQAKKMAESRRKSSKTQPAETHEHSYSCEREWQQKLKKNQIHVKFPQILLVKQALLIEQSLLSPKSIKLKKSKLASSKKTNENREQIDQAQIPRLISLHQGKKGRNSFDHLESGNKIQIGGWTINNWSQSI